MIKDKVPEYDPTQVVKLPPGSAEGANDLATWAHRRATGRSGVPDFKIVRFRCSVCKGRQRARMMRGAEANSTRFCKRCGKEQQMRVEK
jgi:hypothetical protein